MAQNIFHTVHVFKGPVYTGISLRPDSTQYVHR